MTAATGPRRRRGWARSKERGGAHRIAHHAVAVARAVISNPKLILADEPTGNLHSAQGREIMELIVRLAKEGQMTTVVTTHDPVLLSLADRVLEISDGVVAEPVAH